MKAPSPHITALLAVTGLFYGLSSCKARGGSRLRAANIGLYREGAEVVYVVQGQGESVEMLECDPITNPPKISQVGEKSVETYNTKDCKQVPGLRKLTLNEYRDAVFGYLSHGKYSEFQERVGKLKADAATCDAKVKRGQLTFDRIQSSITRSGDPNGLQLSQLSNIEPIIANEKAKFFSITNELSELTAAFNETNRITSIVNTPNKSETLNIAEDISHTSAILTPFVQQDRKSFSQTFRREQIQAAQASQALSFQIDNGFAIGKVGIRIEYTSPFCSKTPTLIFQKDGLPPIKVTNSQAIVSIQEEMAPSGTPTPALTAISRVFQEPNDYKCVMNFVPNGDQPEDFVNAQGRPTAGQWTIGIPEDMAAINEIKLDFYDSAPLVDFSGAADIAKLAAIGKTLAQSIPANGVKEIDLAWLDVPILLNGFYLAVDMNNAGLAAASKDGVMTNIAVSLVHRQSNQEFFLYQSGGYSPGGIASFSKLDSPQQFAQAISGNPKGWMMRVQNKNPQPVPIANVSLRSAYSQNGNVSPQSQQTAQGGQNGQQQQSGQNGQQQQSGQNTQQPNPPANPAGQQNTSATSCSPNNKYTLQYDPSAITANPMNDQSIAGAFRQVSCNLPQLYNNPELDPTERTNCIAVCPKDRWNKMMTHYYCSLPGNAIRACFTGHIRDERTKGSKIPDVDLYKESYDFCVNDSTSKFRWIDQNQGNVFKSIMFTIGNPKEFETKVGIIDEYYDDIKITPKPQI